MDEGYHVLSFVTSFVKFVHVCLQKTVFKKMTLINTFFCENLKILEKNRVFLLKLRSFSDELSFENSLSKSVENFSEIFDLRHSFGLHYVEIFFFRNKTNTFESILKRFTYSYLVPKTLNISYHTSQLEPKILLSTSH